MGENRRNAQLPLLQKFKDLSGGLNTKFFPTEIGDNQLVNAQNWDLSDPGIIKKAGDFDAFGATLNALKVLGAKKFDSDDGVVNNLMVAVDNEIHSIDSAGSTAVRATVPTTGETTELLQALDKFYISNGTDDVFILDSSFAVTSVPSASASFAPKFTTSVYAQNRIFTNDTSNKTFVQFTGVLNDTFDQNVSNFKFSEGSGDTEIVKLLQFRKKEIIVFMTNRVEELIIDGTTPLSDWSREVIDDSVGCVAARTVQEMGGTVFWLDQDLRVRAMNRTALDAVQGTQAVPISNSIESELKRINKTAVSKACAGTFDNKYILCLPLDTDTEPNDAFFFDITTQSWTGPIKLNASVFTESDVENDGNKIYFGENDTGAMQELFTDSFAANGATIKSQLETKRYEMGRPESDKTFTNLEVYFKGESEGNFLVEARLDGAALYTTIDSFALVGDGPALPITLPYVLGSAGLITQKMHLEQLERGRNIQFRMTHEENAKRCDIVGWILTGIDENYEFEATE